MARIWLLVFLFCAVTACQRQDQQNADSDETKLKATQPDIAAAPAGQLTDTAYPLAYELQLRIDPRESSFGGQVKIDIELAEPADGIWIHGQYLRVSAVNLYTADGNESEASYQEVLPSGVAWVGFGREQPAGRISLQFEYQADFDQNLAGLFNVSEQGHNYALAKSESIQARKYLPGFDQPGFKAPFTVALTIPKGYSAIGNAPEVSRTSVDDGFDLVQFATTPPMSTYLLSLAVGPFDIVVRPDIPANEYRDFSIPLRGIARSGRGDELDYVLDITPRYIEIFEQELGLPYPFRKLDIVAAPAWPSGATELSGAITYREQRLFLGDNAAPKARLDLLSIHAHEIAHMWFGNQVTPPWWDDLWLKEGFATWATPMVLSLFEPDGGHDLNGLERNFGVMRTDSLASARAIREPIYLNEHIRNAYDGITYSKSQAVIHMLDSYFGAEKFRRALGGYLQTYADGKADSQQFYQTIGEQTGTPELTDVFKDFVEQQGVPLLDVQLDCDAAAGVELTLGQSRYRPLGSSIVTDEFSWSTPACVRYPSGSSTQVQCGIVTRENPDLQLTGDQCPEWVMPNANGSGYYRWQLSTQMWQNLLDNFERLSPAEQLALVDSGVAGFEAGHLDTALLLQVVGLSAQAPVHQVVQAPLNALSRYIDTVLPAAAADDLREQLTPVYLAVLERIGEPSEESLILLRNRLLDFLAITLQYPPARGLLAEQAMRFTGFNQPRDPGALASDLYQAALTVAVQDIGADFFRFLINGSVDAIDDPRFSGLLPIALGRFNDAELLPEARAYSLSDDTGPRESYDMISSMLKNQALRAEHWQWYQAELPVILDKIPSQWRRRTPRVADIFCSEDRIAELQSLFSQYGDQAPGHELALQQTGESIALCAALRAAH